MTGTGSGIIFNVTGKNYNKMYVKQISVHITIIILCAIARGKIFGKINIYSSPHELFLSFSMEHTKRGHVLISRDN